MKKFDIAVIGGGPGGYVAAIRAAQSGRSVALIEVGEMGGTCLNRGCIPTKTLLAGTDALRKVRDAKEFGIVTGTVSFDFEKMAKRKTQVVSGIRKSLEGLIAANKITVLKGFGKFVSPTEIKITGDNNETIQATRSIIATGSEPRDIPAFPFDGEKVHSSTTILQLTKLPKKLVIIGGGVIGCEFATVYRDLGVDVTICELLPSIIMQEGSKISNTLSKAFKEQGIIIKTEVCVEGIDKTSEGITVKLAGGSTIDADMALVAVGRKMNTDQIALEKAGVKVTKQGVIPINERMETNVPNIYAIGDITAKWLLAHVASHQGIVAADNALGRDSALHYHAVPSVIFTNPEIGTVGMTLEKATEEGHAATLTTMPFQILGKSQAAMETEGFAQIVTDKRSGQILGAQVVGHEAATLIAEMTLAINNELTIECIYDTIHAHPTIAEIWMEAALMADNTPIHFPPKRQRKEKKNHANV